MSDNPKPSWQKRVVIYFSGSVIAAITGLFIGYEIATRDRRSREEASKGP